jgi:hypothetical protein
MKKSDYYKELRTLKLIGEIPKRHFSWWDEEKTLLLISPEIYDILPTGIPLKTIGGRKIISGKNRISRDTCFGFLALGFAI